MIMIDSTVVLVDKRNFSVASFTFLSFYGLVIFPCVWRYLHCIRIVCVCWVSLDMSLVYILIVLCVNMRTNRMSAPFVSSLLLYSYWGGDIDKCFWASGFSLFSWLYKGSRSGVYCDYVEMMKCADRSVFQELDPSMSSLGIRRHIVSIMSMKRLQPTWSHLEAPSKWFFFLNGKMVHIYIYIRHLLSQECVQ